MTRQQNIRQLTETQTKAKTEIERLEKEVANCLKQLTEQETALKVTQRLYENARMAVGKDVKALRQQLQEGEACPVCGSTSHPYHREQEVVDILFRNIEQEYNAVVIACQQTNNQHIALQRDLAHQKNCLPDRSKNSYPYGRKKKFMQETKNRYRTVCRNWQNVFRSIVVSIRSGNEMMRR